MQLITSIHCCRPERCTKPSLLLAKKEALHWKSPLLVGLGRISAQWRISEEVQVVNFDTTPALQGVLASLAGCSDTVLSSSRSQQLLERFWTDYSVLETSTYWLCRRRALASDDKALRVPRTEVRDSDITRVAFLDSLINTTFNPDITLFLVGGTPYKHRRCSLTSGNSTECRSLLMLGTQSEYMVHGL